MNAREQDPGECLAFAGERKVKFHISREPLEAINDIFHRMKQETIDGRIVVRILPGAGEQVCSPLSTMPHTH